MKKIYDYLVIGAGSGGLASARRAAKYNKKVGIIESNKLGGTCVNKGCVPKKIMWNAASLIEDFKISSSYGIESNYSSSFNALKANRDAYISRLNAIYQNNLIKDGIDIIKGWGKFIDKNTIQVENNLYHADNILIATGCSPILPTIEGKEFIYTSDEFFQLEKLPEKVLIIGNGYISAELAGIFNSYGVDTTISIRNDIFLRGFDHEIGELLQKIYAAHGIKFNFSSNVKRISQSGGLLAVDDGKSIQNFSHVFSAIGRNPNTEGINLENIGIKLKSGHILVDE